MVYEQWDELIGVLKLGSAASSTSTNLDDGRARLALSHSRSLRPIHLGSSDRSSPPGAMAAALYTTLLCPGALHKSSTMSVCAQTGVERKQAEAQTMLLMLPTKKQATCSSSPGVPTLPASSTLVVADVVAVFVDETEERGRSEYVCFRRRSVFNYPSRPLAVQHRVTEVWEGAGEREGAGSELCKEIMDVTSSSENPEYDRAYKAEDALRRSRRSEPEVKEQ
jgi:hypothetical protein